MIVGSIVVMIVWQLDLQLPMQSVPIITNAVSESRSGKVYSIQHYVITFVSGVKHHNPNSHDSLLLTMFH